MHLLYLSGHPSGLVSMNVRPSSPKISAQSIETLVNLTGKAINNQIINIIDNVIVTLEHRVSDSIAQTLEDVTSVYEAKRHTGVQEKVIPFEVQHIGLPRVLFLHV